MFVLNISTGNKSAVDAYSANLFAVLKDHKCKEAIELVISSHKSLVRKAVMEQGFQITDVTITEGPSCSTKPVQIVLSERLESLVRAEIIEGLKKMKFTELDYKLINCDDGKNYLIFKGNPLNSLLPVVTHVR